MLAASTLDFKLSTLDFVICPPSANDIAAKNPDFLPLSARFRRKMSEFGAFLHKKTAPELGSFSNKPSRLGGNPVCKSFRLSEPSPVRRSNFASNPCGINRSASPGFIRPTKPEKVARQLGGNMVSKSFRLSKPSPTLLNHSANNPCGISRLPSPVSVARQNPERPEKGCRKRG